MSSVIKADERPPGVRGVAFNFEDLGQHAEGYLKQVREHATRLLEQASEQARRIRSAAAEEGRHDAMLAVERLVDEKLARQLATLLPALRAGIAEIHRSREEWRAHWERQAIHLAAAIAERIIRRELVHRPEITLDLVREALDLAAGGGEIRLLLHPADHAALGAQARLMIDGLSALAPATILADERISAGGCRVETRFGVIDQQFEAQLARITEELA